MKNKTKYINDNTDLRLMINKKNMRIWMICSFILLIIYGGMLFIEAIFFNGDMRVAVLSIMAGTPMAIFSIIIFSKFPDALIAPPFLAIVTQLVFLSVGTYLKELDFYIFVLFMAMGIVMVIKKYKPLLLCIIVMTLINLLAIIFLIPHLEWVNSYRFTFETIFFLYGAIFFLFITYNVEQKENHAEQSHASFSSLMRSTPNYIVLTDSQNRVRYISEPLAKFSYFLTQEMAVGKPIMDLFPDKKIKLMLADILNAKGLTENIMTIRIYGKDRHFKVVADKLTDIEGLFIDISDITATVNSKQIAEEAREQAELASATKSKFLANMSHEIRTPMNAIIGIAQIELQKDYLTKEQADALTRIYSSGNSLLNIINDILDLSKIETGKLELLTEEYDVPSLINDTAQINIIRIGSKKIEFIVDADSNLPSKLYGDELRIKQILNNLLSNAIKYTNKGFVRLSISHLTENNELILKMIVEDTGQGMKQEDLEKLFSEYQRFNIDSNRIVEGTGLGLSIVKKLVEMMDGKIDVQSKYKEGSTFTVTIKQKAVECQPIGDEISQKLRIFTFSGEKQNNFMQIIRQPMPYGKVLVVDDVDTNLFVANGFLLPYKLSIDLVKSGYETIDLINAGRVYDIIFMDHMMPYMDGIQTTKILRSIGYKGTIIALTANALMGNREMFMGNGFDGFISKPIDIRDLNSVLNEYVRDKHPEEAKKFQAETVVETSSPSVNPKLLEIFRKDAENAIVTIRETLVSGDMQLFVTTVHAMKSALANIGEEEKSQTASQLEEAGIKKDLDFINANIDSFCQMLEQLVAELTPPESAREDDAVTEDIVFLKEQLNIIKSACEAYDDTTAYAAIDKLREKPWKRKTSAALEKIRDTIYLHSDFDEAAKQTGIIGSALL